MRTIEFHPLGRRVDQCQKTSKSETAGPSQKTPKSETAQPSHPAARETETKPIKTPTGPSPPLSPLTDPVMTGRINKDILELLVHAAKRPTIMNQHLAERCNFIHEVWTALGVEEIGLMIPRIMDPRKIHTRLEVIETQLAFLAQAMEVLQKQLEEKEKALVDVEQARKVAEECANQSAWALADVQTALSFLVDNVNRSLLFSARLEKVSKLNWGEIIRFLLDHSRNMERTWEHMQELAANMTPEGREALTTLVRAELATPI